MNLNAFSEILKKLPPSTIEIIPYKAKDLKAAKQMSALVNHYRQQNEGLKRE